MSIEKERIARCVGWLEGFAPAVWAMISTPTVEDVLREFVDALDIDRCEDFNAAIAEYAAKLRMAGDGE